MQRRSLTILVSVVSALGISATALADSGWASRAELGYALARGNSDSQNGNLKFDIAHLQGKWVYAFGLDAVYGSSNGIGTAQRWDTRFQADRKLSEKMFWFGALRYEDDAYSGFDYQGSVATGLGRNFLQSDTNKLSAQIGVGFRQLRPEQLTRDSRGAVIQRIPGNSADDAVASAALTYEHVFNPSTKVLESLIVESGQSNTSLKNNLALQVQMNSSLALAVAYSYIRNSSPPPSIISKTDQLTTVNLVYEIKDPKVTPTAVALLQTLQRSN